MTGYSNQEEAEFNQTNRQLMKQWVEREESNQIPGEDKVMWREKFFLFSHKKCRYE